MYLEIDEGYPTHRKTLRLCAILKCDTADAYPPRLWSWAMRAAKTGDLTGMEAAEVETSMRYRGKGGALYAAMVSAGFIDEVDGRVEIHDWMERTGAAIARMEASAEASKERKRRWSDRKHERSENADGTPTERVPGAFPERPGTHTDKTSHVQDSPVQASPAKPSLKIGSEAVCGEPGGPVAPPPPAVLTFPCSGAPRSWDLTEERLVEWRPLYPAVDVLAECRKALGWVGANPTRRKTAVGMARFLVGWLGKCQDRGGSSPLGRQGAGARSDGNVQELGNWLEKGAVAG